MATDDQKPDPLEDVRKGLGLLFRAAKTAIEKLPTEKMEDAVVSTAKEVGRAVENVTGALEKKVFKKDKERASEPPAEGEKAAEKPAEAEAAAGKPEASAKASDEPAGGAKEGEEPAKGGEEPEKKSD